MRLSIYGERLITDVQNQFASVYPFLKIEFFKNVDFSKNIYPRQRQIAHSLQLKDAWIWKKGEGELLIDDVMTVSDLENTFKNQFGMAAQVFRRSGNIWLETSITNGWTLKQQNDHGREITISIRPDNRNENE
ncbi:hypothetical protein A4H97_14395 [Niastella yeongjuensis]|uniref:Uncharacterized protein n=1 Tax=Niastella yeongjuensis TaxID=354355 RepID=A0A1V9E411_9BACT|nr:hypothetical protein [Niastella yeongjuensis]OQP40801.1 hypothetical protein A4H97_14395 [Niastella yeongjuensis]SEP01275.1 hypothetical protein SAMN05660816_04175 [Niastella yeongjuensis]